MKRVIKVNAALDRAPLILSVIPAELALPCFIFLAFNAFVFFLWLKTHWVIPIVSFMAMTISWMGLTARGVHTFLSRFERPPYWIRALQYREPILAAKYQRGEGQNHES